jgi:hypothetical protein
MDDHETAEAHRLHQAEQLLREAGFSPDRNGKWLPDSVTVRDRRADNTELLHQASIALIERTPGASTLDDVAAITARSWADLLAEETGISLESVKRITRS